MGHRTLVAYERNGYDLHYAHWGVDPKRLTPETPFGGSAADEWAHEQAEALLTANGGRLSDESTSAVDTDPIATGLSFVDIGGYIDPIEHEKLYVVGSEFSVRTYRIFGLDGRPFGRTDGPTVALVGYVGDTDAAYLSGWLAGARAVRGICGPEDGALIKALRWLDPQRGTVVWLAEGDTSQTERGP